MTKDLYKKLCCPIDKHDLEINVFTETEDGEVIEALMTCPDCNRYFPVVYGIPIMIPDEYRDEALEKPMLKKWGFELKEGESDLHLLRTKTNNLD